MQLQRRKEKRVKVFSHEFHHIMRYKSVGLYENLFDAFINDGLACHFTMEVCKTDTPFYCNVLDSEELTVWEAKARKEFFNTEYDHKAWFFGINTNIPKFTGYTIGFNMVSEYLKNHPDKTASSLYNYPYKDFYELIDKSEVK